MKITILIVGGLLLAAGCGRQTPLRPPQIQYGQVDCAECGMSVTDAHYAAAIVIEAPSCERAGKVFDDIGCMLAYEREPHEGQPEKVLARYVKDFETGGWLDADRAVYVKSNDIHSPMGYGLLAVSTRSAADRLASAKGGVVIDWPAASQRAPQAPSATAR